jgi:hypothetical protein
VVFDTRFKREVRGGDGRNKGKRLDRVH